MDSKRALTKKEAEEKKQQTISYVTHELAKNKVVRFDSYRQKLNMHIPQAAAHPFDLKNGDFNRLLEACATAALEDKQQRGISQGWFLGKRIIYITDPIIAHLFSFSLGENVYHGEASRIQNVVFGPNAVASNVGKKHKQLRAKLAHTIMTPVTSTESPSPDVKSKADVMQDMMQKKLTRYFNRMEKLADENKKINLFDFSAYMALAVIGETFGIKHFPAPLKKRMNKVMHDLSREVSNHETIVRLGAEDAIASILKSPATLLGKFGDKIDGYKIGKVSKSVAGFFEKLVDDYLPSVAKASFKKLINEGRTVISALIEINKEHLLKTKRFTEDQMKSLDAVYQVAEGLVGGAETTGKLIMFGTAMLGDPANAAVVEKIREELAALNKTPDQWDNKDFREKTPYLRAFLLEVFGLFPSFTHVRWSIKKDMTLATDLKLPELKEYLGKSEAEKEEILLAALKETQPENRVIVPANSLVVLSTFHLNRSKKIWGEDAGQCNPERWLKPPFNDFKLSDLMHAVQIHTWGTDERSCPGKFLSLMEGMVVFANLIYRVQPKTNMNFQSEPDLWKTMLDLGFPLDLRKGKEAFVTFTRLPAPVAEVKAEKTHQHQAALV
jgi:hypothetical protein